MKIDKEILGNRLVSRPVDMGVMKENCLHLWKPIYGKLSDLVKG